MRILTRYVLAELIKVFVFALVGLTGAMMLVGVVREALSQGLPPTQILELLPFIVPDSLRYTIPVTILFATTTVYARMSGFNEIVAIKALGISPMAVLAPALFVAGLLSLATVWLNDLAASWGRQGVERVIVQAVEQIAYRKLENDGHYESPNFTIDVHRVDQRRLIRPKICIRTGDKDWTTISAREAELHCDPEENVLRIALWDAQYESSRFRGQERGFLERVIPLSEASRAARTARKPSCLPLREIAGEIDQQQRQIETDQDQFAAHVTGQLVIGDLEDLTGASWKEHQGRLAEMRENLCRLKTEPYRRWAAGFSCLCFVWIGGPMAVWLRGREMLTSFFLCFAPILIVYYPLLAYGINGAKNGTIPPYSVWAGNVLLLIGGGFLLRKVLRY